MDQQSFFSDMPFNNYKFTKNNQFSIRIYIFIYSYRLL